MTLIKVFDNFLSDEDFKYVRNYCKTAEYSYGERDNLDTPPVGMVSNFNKGSKIFNLFEKTIKDKILQTNPYICYRSYINCFAPSENPYFHTDGDSGITLLYYPNKTWDKNDGGETQILFDKQIVGILPIPNRMLIFDANLVHKATSFRNKYRFTIAFKYN